MSVSQLITALIRILCIHNNYRNIREIALQQCQENLSLQLYGGEIRIKTLWIKRLSESIIKECNCNLWSSQGKERKTVGSRNIHTQVGGQKVIVLFLLSLPSAVFLQKPFVWAENYTEQHQLWHRHLERVMEGNCWKLNGDMFYRKCALRHFLPISPSLESLQITSNLNYHVFHNGYILYLNGSKIAREDNKCITDILPVFSGSFSIWVQ